MSIYFDVAASAPMRPEVLELYRHADEYQANPSSTHRDGQRARMLVESARADVATTLGADAVEVLFTGSGTESVNLALKGLFWKRNADAERPIVVMPAGEHHATIDAVAWLEQHEGAQVREIPLQADGTIDLDEWVRAVTSDAGRVAFATAIWANNEIGTVQPVAELARVCADAQVPLHVDAVAAYGHEPVHFGHVRRESGSGEFGLVALSVSAHKIGGPIGIGALVLARETTLESLVHGSSGQRRLHAGTVSPLQTQAFAVAAKAMADSFDMERDAEIRIRDRMLDGMAAIDGVRVNGSRDHRLSNNVHVTALGCESDSLTFLLDQAGFATSSGSACQAGVAAVSHVVLSLGYDQNEARGSVRATFGPDTTLAEADEFVAAFQNAVQSARAAGFADRATRFDER